MLMFYQTCRVSCGQSFVFRVTLTVLVAMAKIVCETTILSESSVSLLDKSNYVRSWAVRIGSYFDHGQCQFRF